MNTPLTGALGPTTSRSYHCVRGALVFLRNTTCLHCGHRLGYDTDRRTMVAIEPAPVEGLWVIAGESESPTFGRCLNLETAAACNWIVPCTSTDAAHWPANLYAGRFYARTSRAIREGLVPPAPWYAITKGVASRT